MTATERTVPVAAAAHTRNHLNRRIVGGLLVLIGALWITERAGWTSLSATAVLAIAALSVGVTLILRSRDGEHAGLIALGLVLTTLTGLTAAAPFEGFQGGIGDRTVTVSSASELDADYELGVGSLVIDLTALDWAGDLGTITVNVGAGEVTVLLPEDVSIDVTGRAGVGSVVILDEDTDGLLVEQGYRSSDFESGQRQITVEANIFVGSIEVQKS